VTDWQVVWLAVMAVALAVMAVIQVRLAIIGMRAARDLTAALAELRREVRPIVDKVHRIADDAARVTSLAVIQVERVDRMVSTTAARVDDAVGVLRAAMGGPIRQGAAVLMAIHAIVSAFRQRPSGDRATRDEEDQLFVG